MFVFYKITKNNIKIKIFIKENMMKSTISNLQNAVKNFVLLLILLFFFNKVSKLAILTKNLEMMFMNLNFQSIIQTS